jgi:hypothetical protein
MVGRYYVEAADWLREAGLTVVETDDWETRARSSGGFASPPLGVQWHHTAGNMNLEANLWWETEGSDVAPIGNMLLWPDGTCYMIAAGAANTAGKGGPMAMHRGVIGVDRGNTMSWAIEAGNNGTGQPWPQAQIDAYLLASNTLNFKFGNIPSDLYTHGGPQGWAPSRKIDPAKASAVLGPWQPRPCTTSGTWDQADVRAEAMRRWAGVTIPPKPPELEDEVTDEDIERIAQRAAELVWRKQIKTPSGTKDASTVLEWIKTDVTEIRTDVDKLIARP